mgnify:CR=1 FL=1
MGVNSFDQILRIIIILIKIEFESVFVHLSYILTSLELHEVFLEGFELEVMVSFIVRVDRNCIFELQTVREGRIVYNHHFRWGSIDDSQILQIGSV